MEELGQYMTADRIRSSASGKTHVWNINDRHGGLLGTVSWFGRWRQYTFSPSSGAAVFSYDCLMEISDFLTRCGKPSGERERG